MTTMSDHQATSPALFRISVISAVYNCEEYIEETFKSLLEQTMPFPEIEIIFVDDGSTDGSLAILERIGREHPENVTVIHKENGGVSSARNAGLECAKGEYLTFLDADDLLSPNVLQGAVECLDRHPEVDIASFAMQFFDGREGGHGLNWKYSEETRIADLDREPQIVQMSISSAVCRASAFGGLRFDTFLRYAEDSKVVQQILLNNRKIALLSSDHIYYYRRRVKGEDSAIQKSGRNPEWYVPYMENFQLFLLELRDRDGNWPKFLQYVLMHDLQYHIKDSRAEEVLDAESAERYRELVVRVLQHIDDDVIAEQKRIYYRHKLLIYKLKYGGQYDIRVENDTCDAVFGTDTHFNLHRPELKWSGLSGTRNKAVLTGRLEVLFEDDFTLTFRDAAGDRVIGEASSRDGAASGQKTVVWPDGTRTMLGEVYAKYYKVYCEMDNSKKDPHSVLTCEITIRGVTQKVKFLYDEALRTRPLEGSRYDLDPFEADERTWGLDLTRKKKHLFHRPF